MFSSVEGLLAQMHSGAHHGVVNIVVGTMKFSGVADGIKMEFSSDDHV